MISLEGAVDWRSIIVDTRFLLQFGPAIVPRVLNALALLPICHGRDASSLCVPKSACRDHCCEAVGDSRDRQTRRIG